MSKRSELQRRAAFAQRAAGVTASGLFILMAAEKLSPPVLGALRSQSLDLAALAAGLVQLLPAAAFTWALLALRGMFAGIAGGRTYTEELPQALRIAGWALTIGAIAAVLVVPLLLTALGKGPGYLIALDAAAIATGAVGVGLIALAALLRDAVAMKSELDEFM